MLDNGMHGVCFNSYHEEQAPGSNITEDQVRQRLQVIKPYTKWIRRFSCMDSNEAIPRIANYYGLKTLVGA